ncbi:hypothetical protein SAMN05421764_10912 [Donghicola eburneus]|nr:hypothetical protein SAMN05421764_10912 [Donghicola eburneus]
MLSHETWLLFGPHLQRTASPATPVLVHISAVRGASLPFQITDAVIIHYPGRMERHYKGPTLRRPPPRKFRGPFQKKCLNSFKKIA